jgi:hypothetical protein
MYITITPQKLGGSYSQSVADYVEYLEKEIQGLDQQDPPAGRAGMEHFFNQYGDEIAAKEVVKEIDGNTSKLKKTEPKFYSITISPSKYELKQLQNSSTDLKAYTREVMKDYSASFYNLKLDSLIYQLLHLQVKKLMLKLFWRKFFKKCRNRLIEYYFLSQKKYNFGTK